MIHKEEIISEHTYFTCDVCHKKCDKPDTCVGCNKHLCSQHRTFWDYNPFTGDDNCDYPQAVCSYCDHKLNKYKKQIREELDRHEIAMDKISATWLQECKEK